MDVNKSRFSLKAIREHKKLSKSEVAKRIGVSIEDIESYELGESYPDVSILKKIEHVYGVSYKQLIFLPLDYKKSEQIV